MGASRHGRSEGPPPAELRRAEWPGDLNTVRRLFREYRDWLADHQATAPGAGPRARAGLELVDRLTAELPGAFGPPRGEILLWYRGDSVVACGALRELEPQLGEIKRISIRPDFRGSAFGRPFVRALMTRARELGYDRLRVDTLSTMEAAIGFYQELGFRPIPSFWPHPAEGALFFEAKLREDAPA